MIFKEYEKVNSKRITGIMPDYLEEYQKTLLNILQYYTAAKEFGATHIEKSRNQIRNLEKKSGSRLPSGTRTIIASLYSSLAEKADWRNVKEIMGYLSNALENYHEALEYESDRIQKADIQKNIGNTYWELSHYIDKNENCGKAVKAYEEALKVFTKEEFPEIYPLVEGNLRKLLDFCGSDK